MTATAVPENEHVSAFSEEIDDFIEDEIKPAGGRGRDKRRFIRPPAVRWRATTIEGNGPTSKGVERGCTR